MHNNQMGVSDYDIEQLWIEGHGPVQIAQMLNCQVEVIHEWLDQENLIQPGCRGYTC